MAPAANPSTINLINSYYQQRASGLAFLAKPDDAEELGTRVEELQVDDEKNKHEKAFQYIGGPEVLLNRHKKVAERNNQNQNAGLTDQVAKESSDSNASTHKLHDVDTQATSGGSEHATAHKANPGPVHADNLPTPESKENLKKRAEELNK